MACNVFPPIQGPYLCLDCINYLFFQSSSYRPLKALALYVRVEQLFFIQLEDLTAPWVLEILYA